MFEELHTYPAAIESDRAAPLFELPDDTLATSLVVDVAGIRQMFDALAVAHSEDMIRSRQREAPISR